MSGKRVRCPWCKRRGILLTARSVLRAHNRYPPAYSGEYDTRCTEGSGRAPKEFYTEKRAEEAGAR